MGSFSSTQACVLHHRRFPHLVLHNLITSEPGSPKGIWAVKITREMWRRQIWTDSKAVEIMKEAALSENAKVISGGVRFFLGGDQEREEAAEDDSEEEDTVDMRKLRHQQGITKKEVVEAVKEVVEKKEAEEGEVKE